MQFMSKIQFNLEITLFFTKNSISSKFFLVILLQLGSWSQFIKDSLSALLLIRTDPTGLALSAPLACRPENAKLETEETKFS